MGWGGALLEWSAEFPGGGLAVLVCPAGDRGHGYAFAEDAGNIGLGRRGEVVLCYRSDGGVAEDAPGEGRGGREEKGEEDGNDSVHCRLMEKG